MEELYIREFQNTRPENFVKEHRLTYIVIVS